jgi:hypothetical protein
MAWDDESLYVAFQCEDVNVQAVLTERDSPVSSDDCVELFAAPDPRHVRNHLVLEMNARGAYLDSLWIDNRPRTTVPFNPQGIKIGVAIDGTLNDDSDADRGWTLELAFPFAMLGDLAPNIPPKPGDVWRLNLNRADHAPDRIRSMWSPVISERLSFHQPEFFGHVAFVK